MVYDHQLLYDVEVSAFREFLPGRGMGLEVGVGSGLFSKPLGISFGVDPCVEMLALARQRGLSVSLGRAESLPCKSNKLDYILMVTVICFFDNPQKAFEETKRVLPGYGKGGFVVLEAWVKEDL